MQVFDSYRTFSGAVVSDVGCVRANNEDNYVLGKHMNSSSSDHSEVSFSVSGDSCSWQFAGVFDGMGGGEIGEQASLESAQIFLEAFHRLGTCPSKGEVDLCMRNAFLKANNRIVDLQQEYSVLGTTGTVLCTSGTEFKIYHLGDSRAYLFRDNNLVQITKDQTLAQMKIDLGKYHANDPAAKADKHKLTEYIGRDWTREHIKPVESQWLPIQSGDQVLLCSDGLYDMCADTEIAGILRKNDPKNSATALVKMACDEGGYDNVTCLVAAFL